jgi:hypothetical protein
MNRSTLKRLEALEQKAPQDMGKTHVILVASDEEEHRETAALKGSSKWAEGDNLMVIRLVAGEFPERNTERGDVDPPSALVTCGQGDEP